MSALVGRAAIREFNADFPPLAAFSLTNEIIDGVGDLAYVRGRYRMTLAIEGSRSWLQRGGTSKGRMRLCPGRRGTARMCL